MPDALALARALLHCLAALTLARGNPAQEHDPQPTRLALSAGTIELQATWERLTDTVYNFEKRHPLVAELKPAVPRATYDASTLRPLLPPEPVTVGDVWRVDVADVLPLLHQLHPGAQKEMHHDGGFGVSADGGWACLRALGPRYAEVRLRVHADILLEGDGARGKSSWFTPAQFAGRMVIDRRSNELVAFELGVPNQSANVDVNIATGTGISADIGRIPRMDLAGGKVPEGAFAADTHQIPPAEAANLLARKFYPLAEIEWLDLVAARARSRATGKPLHVVALFGSLLDESC